MQRVTRYLSALAVLAVMFGLGLAVAAEPEPAPEPATVVVRGDGDAEVTVSLEQGTLTVTSIENGEESTHIVDLEAVGLLVADAVDETLVGMGDMFAGLQNLQLQCRLGQDNRLNLSCDDTEFELDLDQVMAQVASAVQTGLQEKKEQ